jgi:hypothetical protein
MTARSDSPGEGVLWAILAAGAILSFAIWVGWIK